jgi:hypothetical protein
VIGIDDDLIDAHMFKVEAEPTKLVENVQFLGEGKALESILEKKKTLLDIKFSPFTMING